MHQEILELLRWGFAIVYLIPCAVIDYKKHIIPNRILPIGCGLAWIFAGVSAFYQERPFFTGTLLDTGWGLLVGGGFFLLTAFLSKGGVGMGDVKGFGVLGMILGWTLILQVIFFALLFTAVVGGLMLIGKKISIKSAIPLAPFMLLGTLTAAFLNQ